MLDLTSALANPLKVKVDICNIDVEVLFGDTRIATVNQKGLVFDFPTYRSCGLNASAFQGTELSSKVLQVSLNIPQLLHLVRTLGRKTICIVIKRMESGTLDKL